MTRASYLVEAGKRQRTGEETVYRAMVLEPGFGTSRLTLEDTEDIQAYLAYIAVHVDSSHVDSIFQNLYRRLFSSSVATETVHCTLAQHAPDRVLHSITLQLCSSQPPSIHTKPFLSALRQLSQYSALDAALCNGWRSALIDAALQQSREAVEAILYQTAQFGVSSDWIQETILACIASVNEAGIQPSKICSVLEETLQRQQLISVSTMALLRHPSHPVQSAPSTLAFVLTALDRVLQAASASREADASALLASIEPLPGLLAGLSPSDWEAAAHAIVTTVAHSLMHAIQSKTVSSAAVWGPRLLSSVTALPLLFECVLHRIRSLVTNSIHQLTDTHCICLSMLSLLSPSSKTASLLDAVFTTETAPQNPMSDLVKLASGAAHAWMLLNPTTTANPAVLRAVPYLRLFAAWFSQRRAVQCTDVLHPLCVLDRRLTRQTVPIELWIHWELHAEAPRCSLAQYIVYWDRYFRYTNPGPVVEAVLHTETNAIALFAAVQLIAQRNLLPTRYSSTMPVKGTLDLLVLHPPTPRALDLAVSLITSSTAQERDTYSDTIFVILHRLCDALSTETVCAIQDQGVLSHLIETGGKPLAQSPLLVLLSNLHAVYILPDEALESLDRLLPLIRDQATALHVDLVQLWKALVQTVPAAIAQEVKCRV